MVFDTIRLAKTDEAGLVRDIKASAYVPAYREFVGAVPRPAFEDYQKRIESGDVWIAEILDKPVAVLVVEANPDFLMVYSVAVDPRWQGKGLGKALLAYADQCAIKRGLREIRLHTNSKLLRNIGLYESSGFVRIGERPHPNQPGQVLIDMAKTIDLDAVIRG